MFQALRASIPMKGRSLTLYEKVYPESQLNTNKAHQEFLNELERILPQSCKPIIVSDAVYRSPWFKMVEEKSWYWIGRARGQVSLSQNKMDWKTSYQWFSQAHVGKAEYIGSIYYRKIAKFPCNAVIYKRSAKGRKAKKYEVEFHEKRQIKLMKKIQESRGCWFLSYQVNS